MTEYFPGSRQVITPPAGPPPETQVPPGKQYTIGGKPVELYTIGQVAEVLNRKPVTIRKWEREGVIPSATFVKPGANGDVRGRRRLYSRAQVEALLRIAMEEKILNDLHKQITKTEFKQKALAAFRELASR